MMTRYASNVDCVCMQTAMRHTTRWSSPDVKMIARPLLLFYCCCCCCYYLRYYNTILVVIHQITILIFRVQCPRTRELFLSMWIFFLLEFLLTVSNFDDGIFPLLFNSQSQKLILKSCQFVNSFIIHKIYTNRHKNSKHQLYHRF